MPTREKLREDASAFSDEELIDRLRRKGLTELATEVTRHELAARGIDVERALSEPPQTSSGPGPLAAAITAAGPRILRRVLRFPFRAALGVEPLWAVVLLGGAIVLVAWRMIVWGVSQLLYLYPTSPYALPSAYAALGTFAVVLAWWGIALWRTGGLTNDVVWMVFARIAAVICALVATFGTMGAARVVQEYFAR